MTPAPMQKRLTIEAAIEKRRLSAERKAKRLEKAKELWPKRQPKKITEKSFRKKMIPVLDRDFSLAVRHQTALVTGGRCGLHEVPHKCGGKIEECFHYLTRAKYSIRWDFRNAIGTCSSVNINYEHDRDLSFRVVSWVKQKKGPEFWDKLVFDGNQTAKHASDDLLKIWDEIKPRLPNA